MSCKRHNEHREKYAAYFLTFVCRRAQRVSFVLDLAPGPSVLLQLLLLHLCRGCCSFCVSCYSASVCSLFTFLSSYIKCCLYCLSTPKFPLTVGLRFYLSALAEAFFHICMGRVNRPSLPSHNLFRLPQRCHFCDYMLACHADAESASFAGSSCVCVDSSVSLLWLLLCPFLPYSLSHFCSPLLLPLYSSSQKSITIHGID